MTHQSDATDLSLVSIDLPIDVNISSHYITDSGLRLQLYRRLLCLESKEAIFEADSIDEHNKGKGLLVRNLISNILVTESGMYGLHPRPYTVSVG